LSYFLVPNTYESDRADLSPGSGLYVWRHFLFLDFASQPAEKAHVQIGHRYQRESGDQIASPVIEQQLIACDIREDSRDVVI
jgi:hypothetical protein